MTTYRPSVCLQTNDEHTHYNIVLIKQTKVNDLDELRNLASRIGGQTAGQFIEILQSKIADGIDISPYNINYLQIEELPSYQVCHKGEVASPAIDWDQRLFGALTITPSPSSANCKVARITHS